MPRPESKIDLFTQHRATEMELNVVKERSKSIVPPRLEDAGLEDCALPVEGIREAFARAALAVKSRLLASENGKEGEEEADCVEDSGPSNGEWCDELQGNSEVPSSPGRECVGWPLEEGRDEIVGIEDEASSGLKGDVIVVGVDAREKSGSCVQGLGFPEELEKNLQDADDDEDEDEKDRDRKPILVEGYV